ncbi:hypothetical protein QFX18_19800 [Saccharophagus degradans]|uniref:hypothetical protein n=1 Tax=Saccharophagus degradans TaxID=86304 RepID=UPI0024780485|nr:hypothetical protein [Saccharophagus degradans]WGO98256.1 hypothetical protein QFX18_19800 [Saccharophagus degradans]
MDIEEIAIKYKSHNGMDLIDFSEVALPIYRISAIALLLEKVELHTIDEFVLRAVNLGFKTLSDVSGLLGISEVIARSALSSLIQANLVAETGSCSVSLTKLGIEAAENFSKIRPTEEQIVFDYDGILRSVKLSTGEPYLSPKEVKDQGLIEIRAIPARKPDIDEIVIQDVSRALSKFSAFDDSNKTLLRIREIPRAVRLFYKGVMLIYKDYGYNTFEAAFSIDGNLSPQHGLAFLQSEGLERLGLIQALDEPPQKTLESTFPQYCRTKKPDNNGQPGDKKSIKRKTLSLAKDNMLESESVDSSHEDGYKISTPKIRTLAVYEHPAILYTSMKNARESLIIISPWITSSVVTRSFVHILEGLLKKGVEVKIGFGIGGDDRYDRGAQSLLNNLSNKYNNLILKELGDTHAKVLIKDNSYYVITSFNWLSFKGDPKKKFREEWGNYVEGSELVEKFKLEIENRFNDI